MHITVCAPISLRRAPAGSIRLDVSTPTIYARPIIGYEPYRALPLYRFCCAAIALRGPGRPDRRTSYSPHQARFAFAPMLLLLLSAPSTTRCPWAFAYLSARGRRHGHAAYLPQLGGGGDSLVAAGTRVCRCHGGVSIAVGDRRPGVARRHNAPRRRVLRSRWTFTTVSLLCKWPSPRPSVACCVCLD
jgi:hypothetical protein